MNGFSSESLPGVQVVAVGREARHLTNYIYTNSPQVYLQPLVLAMAKEHA